MLQNTGTPYIIYTSHFLQLLPLAPQGMRTTSSAVLLEKTFPCFATNIQLKRSDSFRHLQGLVIPLIS